MNTGGGFSEVSCHGQPKFHIVHDEVLALEKGSISLSHFDGQLGYLSERWRLDLLLSNVTEYLLNPFIGLLSSIPFWFSLGWTNLTSPSKEDNLSILLRITKAKVTNIKQKFWILKDLNFEKNEGFYI